ncbi:ethanolamine utilization protein EutP [Streptococcus gallinaceus]|uniref:EutP/PduV family microcompartment system protein n=1 Tax=Streptococcus gallinaceus TaxID=165758 RepID=UPI00209E75F0|nr:EutP/PduV family microcompartment system protein [Streptococcus gallinaceus]MCP1639168.1 ethanolamine utilization protein EutP [Streptococcus gallinaceus]MCP1770189.1 ethanolamine utilization protein EutP [Streptococcus gallinaceus]
MKKRIMVIGPTEIEKEKMVELFEEKHHFPHVRSVVYLDQTIQIPSSYLRGSGMMKHIIAIQQNASAVLMLLSANRTFPVYSPNFAKVFRIPTIGVILSTENEENRAGAGIAQCRREFEEAKVDSIHELDLENASQCQQFLQTMNQIKEGMI